jgi:hypothetical protein
MKKTKSFPLYNSDTPPASTNAKKADQTEPAKPTYLKALLSGTTKLFSNEKPATDANSDRKAALRYIKNSALLKNLYFGKMTC